MFCWWVFRSSNYNSYCGIKLWVLLDYKMPADSTKPWIGSEWRSGKNVTRALWRLFATREAHDRYSRSFKLFQQSRTLWRRWWMQFQQKTCIGKEGSRQKERKAHQGEEKNSKASLRLFRRQKSQITFFIS